MRKEGKNHGMHSCVCVCVLQTEQVHASVCEEERRGLQVVQKIQCFSSAQKTE